MGTRADETRATVRDVVEQEVARINSPEAAAAVVHAVERQSAGKTEQSKGDRAAQSPAGVAANVVRAAESGPPKRAAAKTLVEAAAAAVAPSPEAPAAMEGAREVLAPRQPASPAVRRGRRLLKEAVLRRMAPLQALDAALYLDVNEVAHPPWLDAAFSAYTNLAVGGWVWIGCVLGTTLLGVPGSRRALLRLAPTVTATTLAVEYPIKAIFRRRRPFIDIVRALVIGKRPGSWSFPSGHTAASFAAARVLSTSWPRVWPLFYGLAALVGFSRVYVGDHYPGDVASGALIGTGLASVLPPLIDRVARQ